MTVAETKIVIIEPLLVESLKVLTPFHVQEYTKSPPKKVKKEQPEKERVRNTMSQDNDISPTAMLDQTSVYSLLCVSMNKMIMCIF